MMMIMMTMTVAVVFTVISSFNNDEFTELFM